MNNVQEERIDFTILDNDIIRDTNKYGKNEVLAYMAINFYANSEGTCFPSYEGIARIMRTSRTTAIQAVQSLVEKGIIKLENRKADEKKKELTSNLYTLVSNPQREMVARENGIYLVKKGADYKKRYAKGKATKIANQNAKEKEDKKNTPDSMAVEPSVYSENLSNSSFDKSIIAQDTIENKEEKFTKNMENTPKTDISPEFKVRLDMLKQAGIKYIPYKTEVELIESLDLEILKQAIEVTVEQSYSKSFKYLMETFDTIQIRINREKEEPKQTGGFTPRFGRSFETNEQRYKRLRETNPIYMATMNIGGKPFDEWDADELEKEVLSKQAEKWA